MKKMVNWAMTYGVLALIFGVFYREVTKYTNYTGETTLSVIHTHLFAMGMLVFLILIALDLNLKLTEHKKFNLFMITYNCGLLLTVFMMLVRGLTQVFSLNISTAVDASISGISGLGHICWAFAIVLMLIIIKKQIVLRGE